jgi:hypothetical protein
MRVERWLQIHTAALTALGTLLLGMGEREATLPVLAVIVAVSSVYLTDVKGWLRLNTMAANVAGLVALAVTWRDWERYQSDSQLVAMTNLLIYLQFVLLYRRKNVRNYWLLALLSLMQVAVASALNLNIGFGLLLLAYLFVGLVMLALLFLHREQANYAPLAADRAAPQPGLPPAPQGGRRRWPLAVSTPQLSRRLVAGPVDAGLTWGFARRIALVGASSIAFAMIVFLAVPRVGKSNSWRPHDRRVEQHVVAFSENVTLGELGQIIESDSVVMTVWFFDDKDEPYRIAGSPLLRGALLYGYENGEWSRGRGSRIARPWPSTRIGNLPKEQEWVRQEIKTSAGRDDNVLFCAAPSFKVDDNVFLMRSESEQVLRSGSFNLENPFQYVLWTPAFRDHLQRSVVPALRTLEEDKSAVDLLQLPAASDDGIDPLGGLKALARQKTGDFLPAERFSKAHVLADYLRTSGEFKYSLKPAKRERNLDPIEDFVTLHKSGHCEYFATALILMLRSVNIPARMAIGFKGGEWNSAGKYYEFQDLHTHTWVEVYLPPSMLPPQLADSEMAKKNGAWLQLDPTPASGDLDIADESELLNIRRLSDLTQYLWSNYVLGLDSKRQKETIYQPLVGGIEELFHGIGDAEYWQHIWENLKEFFVAGRWGLARGWLSWQGFLVVMLVLLVTAVAYRGLKLLVRTVVWLVRQPFRAASRRRGSRRVDFYERFEALMARHGLRRPQCQTQHEFAVVAGGQFSETPGMQHAAQLPRHLADAFYRVRFGRIELNRGDSEAVEQALSELTSALAVRGANGNGRR